MGVRSVKGPITELSSWKKEIIFMKKNISCHEKKSQQAKDYIKTRTEQRFYSLISLPKEKTLSPP